MEDENKKRSIIELVDLAKIESMAFTTPLSYRFSRRQERTVDSWKCLYAELLREFFQILSTDFDENRIQAVFSGNEIGDKKAAKSMKKPETVRRGVYIDCDLSPDTMLRRIRDILLLYKLPLSYVSIKYSIDIERKEEYALRRQSATQEKAFTLDWNSVISLIGAVPISFKYRSSNTRKVNSWTDLYVAVVTQLLEDYPQKIKPGTTVGDRRSPDIVRVSKQDRLYRPRNISQELVIETQGTVNNIVDRLYRFLELCRLDPQQVTIKFRFDDAGKEREYLWTYSRKKAPNIGNEADISRSRRYRYLLSKHFPNGFRLNSTIDMSRLRELYRKQYSEELLHSDSEVTAGLQRVGRIAGDRILTQRTETQELLISDMRSLIERTFAEGASCIYLQQLYAQYETELADKLGMYSYEGLVDIIEDIPGMIYTIRRNCVCYGRRKPDPSGEVISVLKQLRRPSTEDEIAERIWYIPNEKIHQVLQSTATIVTLGNGQFYYAPNFPLTRNEKAKIRSALDSLLRVQEQITEMELLGVLVQECPEILNDAKELSWQGFLGCMHSLFGDSFSCEGNVIIRNNRC